MVYEPPYLPTSELEYETVSPMVQAEVDKYKDYKPYEHIQHTEAYDPTDAFIGRDTEGNNVHYPLSKMVHTLVTGTTGSGKSVTLNQILISMISHATPDELRLAIVDPKKVEFSNYKNLPFMLCNPVVDMGKASDLLSYLAWEMDRRFDVIAQAKQRNLEEYRSKAFNNNEMENIPYVVCVIDEYADLIQTHREVEDYIVRLGQKARACGIHLVVATQTPRAEFLTGRIKANLPSKLVHKAASANESNIALGEEGAEKLRDKGDMWAVLKGRDEKIRCQAGYIPTENINIVLEWLRQAYPKPKLVDFERIVEEEGLSQKGSARMGASRIGGSRSATRPHAGTTPKKSGVIKFDDNDEDTTKSKVATPHDDAVNPTRPLDDMAKTKQKMETKYQKASLSEMDADYENGKFDSESLTKVEEPDVASDDIPKDGALVSSLIQDDVVLENEEEQPKETPVARKPKPMTRLIASKPTANEAPRQKVNGFRQRNQFKR